MKCKPKLFKYLNTMTMKFSITITVLLINDY